MDLSKISIFLYGPVILGIIFEVVIVLTLAFSIKYFEKKKIIILFDLVYEKIFGFFEEILGKKEKLWLKTYLVILFFTIFISNIIGVMLEFLAPMFGVDKEGEFYLEHYIHHPTSDLNFTVALAIISILLLVFIQLYKLGPKHFLFEYVPISGKGYVTIEKGNMNKYLYNFLFPFVKGFDIALSIFLSLLEFVGLLAKVVSLSLRLFGNMISGTILVTMIVVGLSVLTKELTSSFGGYSFPIILPIFIYLQELLIAFIQAIIFPMLVAIFIKTSVPDKG